MGSANTIRKLVSCLWRGRKTKGCERRMNRVTCVGCGKWLYHSPDQPAVRCHNCGQVNHIKSIVKPNQQDVVVKLRVQLKELRGMQRALHTTLKNTEKDILVVKATIQDLDVKISEINQLCDGVI